MKRTKGIKEVLFFQKILPVIEKQANELYRKHTQRYLRYYSKLDRFIHQHCLCWYGIGMLVSMVILVGAFIVRNVFYSEITVILFMCAILVSLLILAGTVTYAQYRLYKIRSGPTGDHRFYLMAKWLKEEYERRKLSIDSLKLALQQYIKDKNWISAYLLRAYP